MGGSDCNNVYRHSPKKRRRSNVENSLSSELKHNDQSTYTPTCKGNYRYDQINEIDHQINRRVTVDLDIAENSDSELSTRSFSTSGVSSLLPRTWALGTKVVHAKEPLYNFRKQYTSVNPQLVQAQHPRPCSVSHIQNTSFHRSAKRQRLFHVDNDDYRSTNSVLSERPKPTYGGAASCRSIRDIFKPAKSLKFELHSPNNPQPDRVFSNTNLSSTAQRILNTLEQFSTPLSVFDKASLSIQNFKPPSKESAVTTFTSHTFVPYLSIYKDLQKLRNDAHLTSSKAGESQFEQSKSTVSHLPTVFTNTTCVFPTATTNLTCKEKLKISNNENDLFKRTINPSTTFCEDTLSVAKYTFASPIHVAHPLIANYAHNGKCTTEYFFSIPKRVSPAYVPEFSSHLPITISPHIDVFNKTSYIDKEKWRCEICLLENPITKTICSGCMVPKLQDISALVTQDSSNVNAHDPTKSHKFDSLMTDKLDKWECPTCLVYNQMCVNACACCQTQNSKTKCQLNSDKITGSLLKSSYVNKWECPTCIVFNKDEIDECPCCKTQKPGSNFKKTQVNLFHSSQMEGSTKFSTSVDFGSVVQTSSNVFSKSVDALKSYTTSCTTSECQVNISKSRSTFIFGQPSGASSTFNTTIATSNAFTLASSALICSTKSSDNTSNRHLFNFIQSCNTKLVNGNNDDHSNAVLTGKCNNDFSSVRSPLILNPLSDLNTVSCLSTSTYNAPSFMTSLSNNSSSMFGHTVPSLKVSVPTLNGSLPFAFTSGNGPISSSNIFQFGANMSENTQSTTPPTFSTQNQNNLFSVENSAPRKKAHAIRRLRR